jgi:membrane-associated phospholipid phosphatase
MEISPMSRRSAVALGFLVLLAACGGGDEHVDATPIVFRSPNPQEPTAGTWRTWLLASGSSVRPPAPPAWNSLATQAELDALEARVAARGAIQTANIDDWNDEGTCAEWMDFLIDLIKSRRPPPPRAARILGLVSVSMHDAAVASFDAKYFHLRARPASFPGAPAVYGLQENSPSYVSERAAISTAVAMVLTQFFPLDAAAIDAKLQSALDADLDAAVHFPSDVDAGEDVGTAVGNLALARMAADHGDDAQPTYTESGIVGRWERTPQNNGTTPVFPPVLPGWGNVTCWYLASGSAVRPGPCPAYGSAGWNTDRDEVLSVFQNLTVEQKAIADFWADGPGTATPPGHWAEIAVDAGVAANLVDVRMARVLALLNTAQHDAFVACWECKYFYDVERPITTIRRDVAGQSAWLPYINTPAFPTYPSGHSTTSGAAGTVLAHLFPASAAQLQAWAVEAKDSRLYGGIHFRFDNDTGLSVGQAIGALAVARAQTDGG